MENKFYTDDEFEQFLKETTDNFRMYPSKKVWYSIYNDLHPSRKWPSLAVCLLLIFAILFVGITNNNSINKSKRSLNGNNYFASTSENTADETENAQEERTVAILGTSKNPRSSAIDQDGNVTGSRVSGMLTQKDLSTYFFQDNGTNLATPGSNILVAQNDNNINPVLSTASAKTTATSNLPVTASRSAAISGEENNTTVDNDLTAANVQLEANTPESKEALKATPDKANILKDMLSKEDKEWIENYAYNNQASISKFKSRAAIQYYVTPSIGFRFLKRNNDFHPNMNQQTLVSSNGQPQPILDINDEVTQKSAINMEAGVVVLYNISKRTRLKGGLQFNYTSYISFADGLKHPTQSYLLLNNNGGYTMAPCLSGYSNSITGDKNERLNNKTVQLSLPLGADFKLLGKDKLKWYAGATVQPSFTTGGQVYAISADTKNYVEQNDLLRKWNFAAGVETFVSFKTPGGITINAGPQLRYQFLSTYKKQYSYTEKLYNVGIKLGLTKSF
ncbi:hypothetical protein [Ferruginibacter sp. HRS2-29]|uniref:hypothetical protein n=1 Tax=Ferruginibacter sp. HRS2-29 TaxID=2487334 RepID=UPI0020CF5D78|nr:hypothetical protein [Ferruginibacter sp. HRS2-29]MCP9751719.1 hypothetical protein [Ferruginibacter sp. HRS2-29]